MLAMPAVSEAGVFKNYSCRKPDGALAPSTGWSIVRNGGPVAHLVDGCAEGNGLRAELNAYTAFNEAGMWVGWAYNAPEGTAILGTRAWRSYAHYGSQVSGGNYAAPYIGRQIGTNYSLDSVGYGGAASAGNPAQPTAPSNIVATDTPGGIQQLDFRAGCDGYTGHYCLPVGPATLAKHTVHAFEATTYDGYDPEVSAASGSLTASGSHAGTDSISFRATDRGGGVYRAIVEIDGQPVKAEVLDTNEGRCADAGQDPTDPYEFAAGGAPCKLVKDATLDFDTRTTAEGPHALRVKVEDAGGNRTTAYTTESFVVDNVPNSTADPARPPAGGAPGAQQQAAAGRGGANGMGASEKARLSLTRDRGSRLVRFGRSVELKGTLLDEHRRPIEGASLRVLQQVRTAGTTMAELGTIKTDQAGNFTYTAPAGPSRTIRFAYRAFDGDTDFADTTDLTLRVRAGIALKRNPRKVLNGDTVQFRGRVLGAPMPQRGILVDLQALVGKRWRTFQVLRTRRDGAFRHVYRFLRTTGTVTYKFRARVRSDSSYPYELGGSNRVKVRVRG